MAAFGRPLQLTVRRMLQDHSPVCPVCNVGVSWPNGRMDQEFRMPLGMEVGLSQGDTVIDGDPAHPPKERGTAAAIFRAMSIVAKRWPISATAELLLHSNISFGNLICKQAFRTRLSRIFQPCVLLPHFPVPQFPPLHF